MDYTRNDIRTPDDRDAAMLAMERETASRRTTRTGRIKKCDRPTDYDRQLERLERYLSGE